ncbi:MAG: gluconate kinase, partial [Actinobacteria bacterium]|nr:gluconate kinase [Actinomycetota bacterium]
MTELPAAVAETHTAVLFFVGDRAYKLKKALDLGFLDHTTREARLAACRQEVALNRRLAPDVYLGVLDVTDADGTVRDHLVEMRRMPEDRRLARCLERGEDLERPLRAIAHAVAALHEQVPPDPVHDRLASPAAVRGRWTASFDQLHDLVVPDDLARRLARIEELALRYLDGRTPLFEQRIAEGRIRDGHGDLQAEDIFVLDDGPRVLDCIEFGEDYRWGDVLADVAFLAMDLERLGRPDLGTRFLALHRELSAD